MCVEFLQMNSDVFRNVIHNVLYFVVRNGIVRMETIFQGRRIQWDDQKNRLNLENTD